MAVILLVILLSLFGVGVLFWGFASFDRQFRAEQAKARNQAIARILGKKKDKH